MMFILSSKLQKEAMGKVQASYKQATSKQRISYKRAESVTCCGLQQTKASQGQTSIISKLQQAEAVTR